MVCEDTYVRFAEFLMEREHSSGVYEDDDHRLSYEYIDSGDSADVYYFKVDGDEREYVLKLSKVDVFLDYRLELADVEVLEELTSMCVCEVVRMFDYGRNYVVTEYVKGMSVDEALNRGVVGYEWLARLVDQLVLFVVRVAEDTGYVLGDLSAYNVFVRDDLSWVIVDVGHYEYEEDVDHFNVETIRDDILELYEYYMSES